MSIAKMKMRNKGKVHPSPSSISISGSPSSTVLNLLPAAILALIAALSIEDREVLAYMISRSSSIFEEKKRNTKKSDSNSTHHKPPVFDCECFECYTSFWFRWDSSPNRELIHEAIEAFEEHLASGELSKKNGRGRKREKMRRRPPPDVSGAPAPEILAEGSAGVGEDVVAGEDLPEVEVEVEVATEEELVLRSSSAEEHKGLARKVLPDVVGLLNSRLWSLWSPNV